ncbi:MAG: hypothetical protein ACR650_01745 [Methylocystis sp.]
MTDVDLKDTLEAVFDQVLEISLRWKVFRQLFDSGEENIVLLNNSGSFVFGLVQRLLLYDAVISLSRLTDGEKSCGQENASIKNLFVKAKKKLSPEDIEKIERSLCELEGYTRSIRNHRNKTLAHADLKRATGRHTFQEITYDELELSMKSIQEIVIILGKTAGVQINHYETIIPFGCDGSYLLKILRKAHEDAEVTNDLL